MFNNIETKTEQKTKNKCIYNNEEIERICYIEMNTYFNNLRICDFKEPHGKSECCYMGTIQERLIKFNELKDIYMKKYNTEHN